MNTIRFMGNSPLPTLGISAVLAVMLVAGSAHATSQCKGLENAACNANTLCSWVGAYERKDGKKVKAFCRTKSRAPASKANKDSKAGK